jgi:hypothetical protein
LQCSRLHHREPLIACGLLNAAKEDREMKIELDNDDGIVELDGKHMFVVRNFLLLGTIGSLRQARHPFKLQDICMSASFVVSCLRRQFLAA